MKILTIEQLDELKRFDTPTISNAIEKFGIRPAISGFIKPGMILRTKLIEPMVGYAVTAKVSAAYPLPDAPKRLQEYYQVVYNAPNPSIAVIQDIDNEPIGSFWGEVQATTHKALGCVGTITKGGVRDLNECDALGFTFFSTDLMASRGYTHIEESACAVNILGLTIHPGDLIHADIHGVVLIPDEIVDQVATVCRNVQESEIYVLNPAREAIRKGKRPLPEEIMEWRKLMKNY